MEVEMPNEFQIVEWIMVKIVNFLLGLFAGHISYQKSVVKEVTDDELIP